MAVSPFSDNPKVSRTFFSDNNSGYATPLPIDYRKQPHLPCRNLTMAHVIDILIVRSTMGL